MCWATITEPIVFLPAQKKVHHVICAEKSLRILAYDHHIGRLLVFHRFVYQRNAECCTPFQKYCCSAASHCLTHYRWAGMNIEISRKEWSPSNPPKEVTNDTKLIVFLHFHKAGGSSIVNAANWTQNLFRPNRNGNPRRRNYVHNTTRKKYKFWTFDEHELTQFFSLCLHQNGATFIAMENDYFRESQLIDDAFKQRNRIELVTQIRDPFTRFNSNYFFDIRLGVYSEPKALSLGNVSLADRLRAYHECTRCFRKKGNFHGMNDWNMYVRVLSNQYDRNRNVTEQDLETAKKELDKFDLVTVLEETQGAVLWQRKYNIIIEGHNAKINKKHNASRIAQEIGDFKQEYQRLNRFDYALYKYAVQISNRMEME